ncbi:MAG: glutamate racemase [Bacteroidia bacterium]
MSTRPIGVFDSGLGGLTVLKALQEILPNEQFIYYGDTAHLPYGEKSSEALEGYIRSISTFLEKENCKLLVVACNSASTVLDQVDQLPFERNRIVNVIDPIANLLARQRRFKNVAIIGTRKTINSQIFEQKIRSENEELMLLSRMTPLLAPMIEEGFFGSKALYPIFDKYFKGFDNIDLIVPACTHYPMIYEQMESYFERRLKVLHTPKIIAEHTRERLQELNELSEEKSTASNVFHLSDLTDSFQREAEMFLGSSIQLQKTLLDS